MTFRSPTRVTELEGINYVRGIVQAHNSIYQEIARENDQGNDAFIEFVIENKATNLSVFIQVKSGESFKDSSGYKITAEKRHLEYWKSGMYLTIGIVYDPALKKAFWIDLSAYLKRNNSAFNLFSHTIRLPMDNEFSFASFREFTIYCLSQIQKYKSSENYGRSLELFSKINEPELCQEGLKSLYSNFKDKPATWFSLISKFGDIKDEIIQRNIIGLISNYANNPDVFWHRNNIKYFPSEDLKDHIIKLVSAYFGEREFRIVFPYIRSGVNRGDCSYLVFLVLEMIKDGHNILRHISFENGIDCDDRNHWFWLYLHIAQHHSRQDVLDTLEKYYSFFPECQDDEVIQGMAEAIRTNQIIPVG